MDTNTYQVRAHDELRVQAALLRTPEFMAQFDPDKFAGQLERIAAAIASTPPGAHSDDLPALLDNLMRAAFDDGDKGREKFSGATMAAREAVLAHVRYASAPPSAAAGVDWPIIVEGLRLADRFFDGDDRYWKPASTVRAAYLAALAAQPGGSDNDRA